MAARSGVIETHSLLLILRFEMNFMATNVPVKRCLPTVKQNEAEQSALFRSKRIQGCSEHLAEGVGRYFEVALLAVLHNVSLLHV